MLTYIDIYAGNLPRCAVCDRTVDQVTTCHDSQRDAWIIVAYCHGKTDEVTITSDQWGHYTHGTTLDSLQIDIGGVAFTEEAASNDTSHALTRRE